MDAPLRKRTLERLKERPHALAVSNVGTHFFEGNAKVARPRRLSRLTARAKALVVKILGFVEAQRPNVGNIEGRRRDRVGCLARWRRIIDCCDRAW